MESIGNVLFLHIPKCGGTTFYLVLKKMLQAARPDFASVTGPALAAIPAEQRDTFVRDRRGFIQGHSVAIDLRTLGYDPMTFFKVALVRELLERRVSEHYFKRIFEIANTPLLFDSACNYMSHHLAVETNGAVDLLAPMEQIDLVFFYLAKRFGLPCPIFEVVNANAARIGCALPSERVEFRRRSRADYCLYDGAMKRFGTVIEAMRERDPGFVADWRTYTGLLVEYLAIESRTTEHHRDDYDIRLVDQLSSPVDSPI